MTLNEIYNIKELDKEIS